MKSLNNRLEKNKETKRRLEQEKQNLQSEIEAANMSNYSALNRKPQNVSLLD